MKKSLLQGYHYRNSFINIPIVDYFLLGNKENLLKSLESSNIFQNIHTLNDCLKYGFPISVDEYGNSMKKLVLFLKNNFNNRINIK